MSMEQFSAGQKESGVNRVVGGTPEDEEEALKHIKNIFDANSFDELEKEKTPELLALIERANAEMHVFLEQYGIDSIEIPAGNIHPIDKSKIKSKEELEKFEEYTQNRKGTYFPDEQGVGVYVDYSEGKLDFMLAVVHEMLHVQGFYSLQRKIDGDKTRFTTRRSGFSIGTGKGAILFNGINESVISELEMRFDKYFMSKWPELADEVKVRQEYRELRAERKGISIEKAEREVATAKGDDDSGYKWEGYGYVEDRKVFNDLVDKLFEMNKEEFATREDVFKMFVTATLTGRLLPIARLIDKTYGPGYFRVIGEKTAKKPKQL